MKRNRGFTLIEVLVALTIFALISTMAFRGLNSVIDTRERVEKDGRKWRGIALFFSRIEQDLSHPVKRQVRAADGTLQPEFVGKQTLSSPLDANLLFTTLSDNGQGEKRIGYRLQKGNIEELVWPYPDAAPQTKPATYVVLEQVKELQLRFLALNNNWVLLWPMPGQTYPKAVEVSVTLDSGEKLLRVFSLL